MAQVHPVAHIDIKVNDTGEGANFFSEVFGWEINSSMPGYPMFNAEGGPGGGFVSGNEGVAKDMQGVLIYLLSHDIDASLRAVDSHGGRTITPRTEIEGGHGAFAVFRDPSGNVLGLYQPPLQAG